MYCNCVFYGFNSGNPKNTQTEIYQFYKKEKRKRNFNMQG